MNIDEIFKIPAIPSGRNKRKMPATPDVDFLDKYQSNQQQQSQGGDDTADDIKGKRRAVDVDAAPIDDNDFAEADDQFVWNDNDEEGRFFGGGLTDEQSKLLELVDQFDQDDDDNDQNDGITVTAVKRMILKFEKAINKNQELRMRYSDDPTKFMESEADLDEEIKNLLVLTQAPHLYPELVHLNSIPSLMSLLSHENTDITIDAIDLISEWLDEDVTGAGVEEEDDDESEAATKGVKVLMDSLLEHELLELLVQNLDRLDEKEESDRQGIFKILGIMENLLSLDPSLAKRMTLDTRLAPWLLKRIQSKEFDSNRGYASEIISILLQQDHDVRLKFCELEAMDILLRVSSSYKRKDPQEEDEAEMLENFFNAMISLLNEEKAKSLFLDGEGIELMLIMLKERTLARIRAVKVLNYALAGDSEMARANCFRFVDATGLKALFPLFMGKGNKKLKKVHKSFVEAEDEEHILCIILSMMRQFTRDDIQRLRLMQKFTQDDYEKVDRLVEMKQYYEERDIQVRDAIQKEMQQEEDLDDMMEEEFYLRRLDAGLFVLQRVCLILAALCAEDQGIAAKVDLLLGRLGQERASLMPIIEEETAVLADYVRLRKMAMGIPLTAINDKNGKTDDDNGQLDQ
ncbi:Catenin-beta-like protein [Absidia repens]|uniref:Catenin-beta-like protein n=1 Tax=Absidia repens TaxID=90262 RepID=A0A1X2INJ9_9FUNG|nr:Catenin-beta-like protein [Absidia repens]